MEDNWEERIAAVRNLIHERFVNPDNYCPDRFGKRLKLHEVQVEGGNVEDALREGKGTIIDSFFDESTDPCRTILHAIAILVDEYPACWVQVFCVDGAFTIVENIWIADPVYTEHFALLVGADSPYESGPQCIALVFEDGAGMISFDRFWTYHPPYEHRLRIAFNGAPERRKVVIEALKRSKHPRNRV